MLKIIGLIVVILVIGAAVYYFGFYKRGKINDRDGDLIPDEVEDEVEYVKDVAKKATTTTVNKASELGSGTKDVAKQACTGTLDVAKKATDKTLEVASKFTSIFK